MKTTIDTNKQYKIQKKIQKEREKFEKDIQKKKEFILKSQKQQLNKLKEKIEKRWEYKIKVYENRKRKMMEKRIRDIEWKKPLKKNVVSVSKSRLKEKLLTLIQKYVRLRDSNKQWIGRCISCWKLVHRTKADGWHYISRMYKWTAYDERNINLQCKYCNWMLNWNQLEYRKNLIKKIGLEQVEELEKNKNNKIDYSLQELYDLIDSYEKLIKIELDKKS